MRTLVKTAMLASAMIAASPAVAQVYGQSGIPAPSHMRTGGPLISGNAPRMNPPHVNPQHGGQRWGGNINGRWHGGMQAPGGWGAYRRPSRGFQLDRYWMSGNFQIPDYYSLGLQAPPNGYFWVRYYDDAVMVDGYGRVRDSVSGIAWADADAEAYADAGYGSASASAAAAGGGGGGGGGYGGGQIRTVEPNDAYYEDESGYGEQRYGAPYPEPRGGYAPPMDGGPSAAHVQCRRGCVQQDEGYGSQGGYSRGGYYNGGGYYGGGATTTTVTIQYAPVVTTTTTTEEVIEESSSSYETTYVSRPRTKLVRRHYAPTKRLRRHGCGC